MVKPFHRNLKGMKMILEITGKKMIMKPRPMSNESMTAALRLSYRHGRAGSLLDLLVTGNYQL